jgi:hypothetical protein
VSYFTSPVAVKAITAGARHFPQHQPPPDAKVVARLDNARDWQNIADDKALLYSLRRPGKFTLTTQNDPEKGPCLEVALQRVGELPAVVAEYAALKSNRPLPIPGRPHSIGMWVKGDSSWGRIMWELEDAKGKRFRSSGGYDGGDWANHSALDFDGWCFMSFPISNDSPLAHIEASPGTGQWQGIVNGHVDYPLKLTGIYVITYRQSLNLTRMAPVTKTIRFKNLTVMGEAK